VRALYERYSPRVYAVVRRIAADDDWAQDYEQEAWIRAIRALPTFRGEARFSTWLLRIAANSLLSQKLEWALDRLPERMRKVLILHDVEGYTHDEIGELLGTTAGTSKSQLSKARGKMRVLLKDLDSSENPGSVDDGKEMEAWSI
jgi:RNA polymerase sigma-70 factor (ECF subfamily)